jgi:DNA-binding PadR family transcriptional regulator
MKAKTILPTKVEETILLAVFKLGGDAYGVAVKNQIKKVTGRDYLYGTLYAALEQMVNKGFLQKRWGEPTPERGGKRKIFFRITSRGEDALKAAYLTHKAVWKGISEDSFGRGLTK